MNTPDTDPRHWIRPELADHTVPIGDVTPLPGNPRVGNHNVIAQSLDVNQQYRPVLVQKSTGHIIAGNNTYHAAHEAGWTHIAARYLDITDEQARRIAAVDNRANDLATYDDRLLAEFLAELPDLDGTGYDPGDLESLRHLLDDSAWKDGTWNGESGEANEDKDIDDTAMWPKIALTVPPHVFEAWYELLNKYEGKDDISKLSAHLVATGHLQA